MAIKGPTDIGKRCKTLKEKPISDLLSSPPVYFFDAVTDVIPGMAPANFCLSITLNTMRFRVEVTGPKDGRSLLPAHFRSNVLLCHPLLTLILGESLFCAENLYFCVSAEMGAMENE
jgi:hypothetical protein